MLLLAFVYIGFNVSIGNVVFDIVNIVGFTVANSVVEFIGNVFVNVYYYSWKALSAAGTKEAADSWTMSWRCEDISGWEAQFWRHKWKRVGQLHCWW